ncbi:uncharacterized protein [Physcomitrium patens]|uniref:uncharacterized protein isoform X2 n=1 Tax=Physcomitrium patens TaxID=3218 RepID=UPI003CCD91F4
MKPPSQKSIIIASSHQIAALLCERRRPSGAIRPSPPLLSSSSSSCEASSLCLPACLPASPQFATKQTPPYATHTQCHPSLAAGFMLCLGAGAEWFLQVKEAMKVLTRVCNPMRKSEKRSPPVTHKIKMASIRMSMDEVAKTYKITPVRRL